MLANALTVATAGAKGFVAEGLLDCTFFKNTGDIRTNQLLPFTVEVDGQRWRITSGDQWVRGSDGDAVFHLFDGFTNAPNAVAVIEPGPMPHGGYPSALVWLAYASGDCLRNGSLPFAPWSDPYTEPMMHLYRCQTRLSNQNPGLPEAIQFILDPGRREQYLRSAYFRREHQSRAEMDQVRRRISSPQPGFVGGEYRVVQHTNFMGLFLPTAFELNVFRSGRPGVSQSNSLMAATYQGRLISLSGVDLASGLPDLPLPRKPVWVGDVRFRHATRSVDGIDYVITNSWPVDTNESTLISRFESKVAAQSGLGAVDWRRAVIIAIIAALAVIPCFLWLARRVRARDMAS